MWLCSSSGVGDGCVRNLQVVAVGVWLLSYVMDWLHELELSARYSRLVCTGLILCVFCSVLGVVLGRRSGVGSCVQALQEPKLRTVIADGQRGKRILECLVLRQKLIFKMERSLFSSIRMPCSCRSCRYRNRRRRACIRLHFANSVPRRWITCKCLKLRRFLQLL